MFLKKSITPVFPGFKPVAIASHAAPVTGGIIDFRIPWTPLFISFSKVGSLPFLIKGKMEVENPY